MNTCKRRLNDWENEIMDSTEGDIAELILVLFGLNMVVGHIGACPYFYLFNRPLRICLLILERKGNIIQ